MTRSELMRLGAAVTCEIAALQKRLTGTVRSGRPVRRRRAGPRPHHAATVPHAGERRIGRGPVRLSRDRYRAGKRLWNPEDDATLRRLYPDVPNKQLARQLRRTVSAIYGRAAELRLHKSPAYLASPHACRLRRGDHVGAAFRFGKGHVPANKGLRRPGWHTGRMQETQFKKGVLNGVALQRFKPIGSTRVADGYVYRKLAAVPGPWTANWRLEHLLVWEAANGPIPPGHALVFKNGDRMDIRLDNLELITRRDLMARNSVHNLPKPVAQVVQLLGALNRQIRRRTRGEEQDRRSA